MQPFPFSFPHFAFVLLTLRDRWHRNMWGVGSRFQGNDSDRFTVVLTWLVTVHVTNWVSHWQHDGLENTQESYSFVFFLKKERVAFSSSHNAAMVLLLHYLSSRLFLWPQDLSDVRAQSKEADSTLQMDWACSCSDKQSKKKTAFIDREDEPRQVICILIETQPAVSFYALTELLHWYTQMLHSSCFASVVLRARRFFPAPRPSS